MTSAGSNIDETFLSEANQILDGSQRVLQMVDSQLDQLQAQLQALTVFRTQLVLLIPVSPIKIASELFRLQAQLENRKAFKCQSRMRYIYGVMQNIPGSEAQQARCKALYLELTSVFGNGQPL